jgi:endogenous inhibitor of DNA gyrase (YacG/DUF329 family)
MPPKSGFLEKSTTNPDRPFSSAGCDMVKALDEYRSPPHKVIAMLKVGLDQIDNIVDDCSDRVWITDHMIAAGSLKCLVVLGISASLIWKRLSKEDRFSEYRDVLNVWTNLCEISQTSCAVVRRFGYSGQTFAELTAELGSVREPVSQGMIEEIKLVVEQQCARCEGQSSRLPGSSEVIESLIGKGKRLLGTSQNNNSLTGQILSLAASTVRLSASSLEETLHRCRISDVRNWLKEKINSGIHVARREDLIDPENGTKVAQA